MEQNFSRAIFAHVIIKLLQGAVYADDKNLWRDLQSYATPIQEHFAKIGLELDISEVDGFARIKQPEADETDENPLPRLMRKQSLNYETTLLCVILREAIEEFDVKSDNTKLFLTQKEIKEKIEHFYKEQPNKSKLWKELSTPINHLVKIGVLKNTRQDDVNKDNNQYEVKRIIKALVSNQKLEEIKNKLQGYVNTIQ
jgi:arsenate reductase-like glutaredoxin family protein